MIHVNVMSDKSGNLGTTITAITGLVAAIGAIITMFVRQPDEPMAEKSYGITEIVFKEAADERDELADELGKIHEYLEGREEIINTQGKQIERLEETITGYHKRPSWKPGPPIFKPLPAPAAKPPSLPKPFKPKPAAKKLPEWDAVQQHNDEVPLENMFAEQMSIEKASAAE